MTDGPDPYRPALVTLSQDVRKRAKNLETGLESEGKFLTWLQEMTTRLLGRLDARVYAELPRQLRGEQGLFIGAMLEADARRGRAAKLTDEAAKSMREHFVANYVLPAHRNAFRELRSDATEYVDEGGPGDEHDPDRQRYIAMRPALNELEEWQNRALEGLLDGFDERDEILDWGHDVLLATHGELDEDWTTRIYNERSTVAILMGESEEQKRARRLFAAHHLLPRFREGVRVLASRAGEAADADSEDREVPWA